MMQHVDFTSFSLLTTHERSQLLQLLDNEVVGDLLFQARNYLTLPSNQLQINAHIRILSSTGILQNNIDLSFAIHKFHTFETVYFQIEQHISRKVNDLFIEHGGILYRLDRCDPFTEYFIARKVVTLECI